MEHEDENIEKDLESILKSVALSENLENYEVLAHKTRTQGEGFLSVFFTGEVLNKDNKKTIQVAIKKAPVGGFGAAVGNDVIYKHEICLYSEILPELDKFQREKKVKRPFDNIPRYLAGNTKSKNIFLAMENLKTAGYVLFDKKKCFDREHLEIIFKTYGKFHALSFVFKQKNSKTYTKLVKNLTNMMQKFTESDEMMEFMKKGYLFAVETFDPKTESDILAKLKAVDVLKTMTKVQTYEGCYKCLIHGDCWSNNMLFKYKESGEIEDFKLLDFQLSYSSTPIHDLSYFFYSGASKKDMDKLDYYLELYYQSFSNFARELGGNPEEIFPLDILKKEWKQYGIWGIFLGCELWLVKLMDREEIENELPNDIKGTEFFDLWNEKIAKVREQADFRERVRNICLHAVEYGVI